MQNVRHTKNNLTSRVIAAGSWTLGGYALGQVLRLGSNLIMTRLLVPEMFGLMALVYVFLYIVILVSDLGIKPSVITSKRAEEEEFLKTAWVIQILRGLIMCMGVLVVAFAIELAGQNSLFLETSVFADEQFSQILAVMSVTLFISSFNSPNIYLANRHLQLGRVTIIGLISQVAGLAVMIIWALYDRSIWALAVGALWRDFLFMVLTHTSFPGIRMKYHWDWDAFWEIFHFGKWIFVSSMITAFYFQGDRLFLGMVINAELLGIYGIAYFLSSSFQGILEKVNSMVFFPMFSEVARENEEKLLHYYYKIRLYTDSLAIFSAGFLFSVSETLVTALYDDRYLQAGAMLKVLAFTLFFTAPMVSGALMYSTGNSKFPALLKGIQLFVLATTMPLFYIDYGLTGVLWAIVLTHMVTVLIDLAYRYKKGQVILIYEFRMFPMAILGYLIGLAAERIISLVI